MCKRMVWESFIKLTPEQRSEGGKIMRPRHVLKKRFQAEGTARAMSLRQGMLVF